MKSLTIIDIARLASVGKSTVSRVLNNDPRVSEKTRDKVNAVIKQHGFTPSKQARAMRSGKSKTIGIIASRLDSPSENRAIRGMLESIYQNDYDVVLMESNFCADNIRNHVEVLAHKQVEGVIVMSLPGEDYSYLDQMPFPVVMMAQVVPGKTSIVYDDTGAITKVMELLQKQGHKRISFIGVSTDDPTSGQRRLQAYLDFCKTHQLAEHYFLGELGYRSGYELAKQALKTSPECLVCASDTIAMGVRKYLVQQGRTDILVSGVGNNEMIRFLFPEHISVRLSYKQSGMKAIELLKKLMAGKPTPDVFTMPCELITV